jgi:hypothetical protein
MHVAAGSSCFKGTHAWAAVLTSNTQVVMMGTQLYNDALVPQHHKYAAHQIALLYVSGRR